MNMPARTLAPLLLLPMLSAMASARAETCEATLSVVQELYNRTVDICPDGDTASDCSGLLIRATHRADPAKGQAFDIWNPSPNAVKMGSTAFSYIRQDINFDDPAMSATWFHHYAIRLPVQGAAGGAPAMRLSHRWLDRLSP